MSKKNPVSPSEALFGFTAWLSTRKIPVILSRHNENTPVSELVKRFCEVNNWEMPRDGWDDNIEMPSSED